MSKDHISLCIDRMVVLGSFLNRHCAAEVPLLLPYPSFPGYITNVYFPLPERSHEWRSWTFSQTTTMNACLTHRLYARNTEQNHYSTSSIYNPRLSCYKR